MESNTQSNAHSGTALKVSSQTCTEEDYSTCSEGDVLESYTIAKVIFKSQTSIVFTDRSDDLVWRMNDDYGADPPDFGVVMGRVDLLYSIPDDLLTRRQRESFRRLLGSAVARLLDDRCGYNALPILDNAEAFLRTRTTERARIWFLSSAGLVTFLALLGSLLLYLFRNPLQARLGVTAFEVALAITMGALGALLSMARRITKLDIDPMAGPGIHYFEGAVRVLAGMAGALFIALCVKANIVLGAINSSDNSLAFLLVVAAVAGASEMLVPSLIKKVEGTLIVDGTEKG
jgi:hypothetical protein